MPVFSIVMSVAITGFVIFAVVVQVRARRAEKQAIAHSEEIVNEGTPDPLMRSRNASIWVQFHERSRWRMGGS